METKEQPIVAIIFGDYLRVYFATQELAAQLRNAGFSTLEDEHGYFGVRFRREHPQDPKNVPLIELVLFLNELGVIFSSDHTQTYPPAHLMRVLQENFILKKPFKSETRLYSPLTS